MCHMVSQPPSLMDSIVKANDQGKIKIKKVTDNTAADVEIIVDLAPGISPDITIDALYAFTDCEVSISPNACVIVDHKPRFLGVHELLRISVENTRELLKKELEIKLKNCRTNGITLPWKKYSSKKKYIKSSRKSMIPGRM